MLAEEATSMPHGFVNPYATRVPHLGMHHRDRSHSSGYTNVTGS
jgi:hypothetical protein